MRLETKAGDDITKNPCEQDHPPGASRQTFEGWKSQDRIEAEWPKSRHKVEPENPGEAGQQNPCCEVKGRRTARGSGGHIQFAECHIVEVKIRSRYSQDQDTTHEFF